MNPRRILTIVLCIAFCSGAFAQTQGMDKELSDLTEKLAAKIKASGKKKVTVLDFTDLDGGTSDLGKYVAEAITVNFVSGDREFTVVDRANLKKILAEHKLTASGLIDPENAKKLGQFSGVDALILGTIVPMSPNVKLTAKIITTDTADIVGGGQCTFKSDENVQQLLTRVATAAAADTKSTEQSKPAPAVKKPIGDLQVKVESLKLLPQTSPGFQITRLTFIITNTSATQTYGVAVHPDFYNKFNLSNSRGDEFKGTEVTGIDTAFDRNDGRFQGSMTDIPPNGYITIVAKNQLTSYEKTRDYRPYRLQTELIWGVEDNGRHPDLKKCNLVLDIK
jgi:TolB-like protein